MENKQPERKLIGEFYQTKDINIGRAEWNLSETGQQKKFLLGSEHCHSYMFLSWMAFSTYSKIQLLWVSWGCFSPLMVRKDQRKPWMLLGNQFSPGKRADCYLDSSPNISYCLWFACSPEQCCGEDGKNAIPTATVPSLHHADLVLLHWLLCNYSWFTSTRESTTVMSDTLDNHQSNWFQAWAKLKDYRNPLRLWSAYHEANRFVSNFCLPLSSSFISLAPGTGLYGPGRSPWLLCFFISHKTRKTTETLPGGTSCTWAGQAPHWG